MASNPGREQSERSNWPRKGQVMTEETYHELAQLSPERKYEYIDGVAYLMSGGSVAQDRLKRNIGSELDRHFHSGSCTPFGVDVQVLLGVRGNGKAHYVYPDATVSCDGADRRPDNTLIESPRTESRDRGVKFTAYQHGPTIMEIVLISQFSQHIEIWQRNKHDPANPQAWQYRQYGPGETVVLASIDVQIAIEEFYRGLIFDDREEE